MKLNAKKATFVFGVLDGKALDHSAYKISAPESASWSAGNTPEDVEIYGVKIPEGTVAYCFEPGEADVAVSLVDPVDGLKLVVHTF